MDDPTALLTTTQVAVLLATTPKVVRRYIDDGRLPATRPTGDRGARLVTAGDAHRLRAELAAEARQRAADLEGMAS